MVSDEKKNFFRPLILRMEVDAGIPFNPHVIPKVHEPWPIDHHSAFDVNILPITPEEKTILDISNWIPK
jgi:hypothetical protein